jgi:hypothetical protein
MKVGMTFLAQMQLGTGWGLPDAESGCTVLGVRRHFGAPRRQRLLEGPGMGVRHRALDDVFNGNAFFGVVPRCLVHAVSDVAEADCCGVAEEPLAARPCGDVARPRCTEGNPVDDSQTTVRAQRKIGLLREVADRLFIVQHKRHGTGLHTDLNADADGPHMEKGGVTPFAGLLAHQ